MVEGNLRSTGKAAIYGSGCKLLFLVDNPNQLTSMIVKQNIVTYPIE